MNFCTVIRPITLIFHSFEIYREVNTNITLAVTCRVIALCDLRKLSDTV